MIKSMTGFGKTEFEVNNRKITVEIKSLNSKQADISARIPQLYREKEIDIRRKITDVLSRGKIDFSIYLETLGDSGNSVINSLVVKKYFSELTHICEEMKIPVNERLLQIVMRLPDAVKLSFETLEEEEWEKVEQHLMTALIQVDHFRMQEGKALEADLRRNIDTIHHLGKEIEPFEKQRIENIRTRMTGNLESLQMNGTVDANRFEQELIFYIERLDFNEEKVRLENHCKYFIETLDDAESNGRKLSFIAQEIGREINTIGSKANDSAIQQIVVKMKDSLERIKEQVLNVL